MAGEKIKMENSIKNILKYQEFDGLIKAIDDEVKKSEVSQQYFLLKNMALKLMVQQHIF